MRSDEIRLAHPQLMTIRTKLAGRPTERIRVQRVLEQARAGRSGILVLRGERGIGKTALLDHAAAHAEGFRMVRFSGAESEIPLPYAGLHLLCGALSDSVAQLHPSQHRALEAAIGRGDGPPDRLLLGLAVLSLLSDAAARQPFLCIIDDAQWIDRLSAQTLAFVLRRLETLPIAVLLAERDPQTGQEFDRMPSLRLGGLSCTDARTLLGSAIRGRIDEAVIERIIAEAHGNPQALLDTLRGVSAAEFAGGFGMTTATGLAPPLTEGLLHSVQQLRSDSRRLLLLAAADPTGDPALQCRAAAQLAIPAEAAWPIEAQGLLQRNRLITFRDPLMQSAIYGLASTEDRREVHTALAAATDATFAPDRRVWHLACAADGADEQLAAELERLAARARERGGPAAAAAFLEKAASLTVDLARRSELALAASDAKLDAGAPGAATRLLFVAELGPFDPLRQGRIERQRAHLAFEARRDDDASELLINAAQQLESLDPDIARHTYLEALAATFDAGRLDRGRSTAAAAKTALERLPEEASAAHLLLDGLVVQLTEGYAAARGPLGKALDSFVEGGTGEDASRWLWLACRVAADLWDDNAWHSLTGAASHPNDTDVLADQPRILTYRAILEVHRGEFDAANTSVDEAAAMSEDMGNPPLAHASLLLAGWRGQEQRALALLDAARRDAGDRDERSALATASFAESVLFNGLGRHEAALAAAQDAARLDELGLCGWNLIELIEAAVRSGRLDAAARALDRLTERTRASRTDWALGIEASSRALLSDGPQAEALYCEAIERLQHSRIKVHVARSQLVYGEWLRRQGRRVDARAQLGSARESFVAMGAQAFADRAHREHLAIGEKSRRTSTQRLLTPQETRIAFLARDGLTNPEIAVQLFVSPRTVEYHLHKVFKKLAIRSRGELYMVLDEAMSPATRSPSVGDESQAIR
jgi:DNA-binding CsgD family transcriptional regulator